jgi:vesicle coat complex subunit
MGFECDSLPAVLNSLMSDDDADVRCSALSLITMVVSEGHTPTVENAIRLLQDQDALVRQTAVLVLGQLVSGADKKVVQVGGFSAKNMF